MENKKNMNLSQLTKESSNYTDYRRKIDELIFQGKTTGNTQTDKLIDFTKLNIQRMNRLDKTIHLSEETINRIKLISKQIQILVIGDAWCGDCAQIIPVINKIVVENEQNLKLNIISRDQSIELINQHSDNGIISIPKVLIIDSNTFEVVNYWGSRPKPALEILNKWKENKDTISHEDFEKELHLWYAKDKGETIIKEILEAINTIKT
jgi:hypothetical protein